MKKKVVGVLIVIVILVGLIIFASIYKFEDSHLRAEGVRVRVNEGALVVSGCEEENAIYCKKVLQVNGEDQVLEFQFVNFKENGYPDAIKATINADNKSLTYDDTINGNEFYYENGLKIEENGSADYPIFLNFNVIDDVIVFTFTDGTLGRTTTLYAIDTKGNIVLEEKAIDEDDMLIKDYTEFITYDDNVITLYATRVSNNINYHKESICNADDQDIVEAYYTYTYQDGKFKKKLKEEISVKDFIENEEIICANEEASK